MQILTFKGGFDGNFSYLLIINKHCLLIDPALPAERLSKEIKQRELTLDGVIVMHSHFDHTVDLEHYRNKNIPIYAYKDSPVNPDKKLEDNQIIDWQNQSITVIHTPGHISDCVCLLIDNNLFTSDTLFVEGCGRADLPDSNPKLLGESLERLKLLPDDTIVYPGHDYGSTPTSTIGREKKNNRFFKKEDFMKNRMG